MSPSLSIACNLHQVSAVRYNKAVIIEHKKVSGKPSIANLSLLDENGLTALKWDLGEQPLSVGRGSAADVRLDDAALSRRHFVIVREGEGFLLKDLNSQNGTFVDGKPAKAARLKHHDCIVAGRSVFLFSAPQSVVRQELAPA